MKSIQLTILLTISFLLIAFPVFGENPFPLDTPAINFQGRVEVDETGFDGSGDFAFTISWNGGSWDGSCTTTVNQGVFNVILGVDTAALPADVFNHPGPYTLSVSFESAGLSPDQSIVAVPLAINSDFLDGLDSPNSAFVGVTDVQTLYNKILGTDTTTSYFIVAPSAAAAPGDTAGAFWYDLAENMMKYYNGADWVELTNSAAASTYWSRADTNLSPATAGDDVSLGNGEILFFTDDGSATNPNISIGNESNTGIYQQAGNAGEITFTSLGTRKFAFRNSNVFWIQETAADPGSGADAGALYFNSTVKGFKYHDGSTWKDIASGTGSIEAPTEVYDTVFATDGSTWWPNNELRIDPDSWVGTKNDFKIGYGEYGKKLYWNNNSTTYISGPAEHTLQLVTNGTERMRIISTANSAATPLISLNADVDTGFFKPAADNIAISTGGVEALRINSNQLVGIGTAGPPDTRVHIVESARNALKVVQGGAFNGIFVDQNGADEAIRIDQDGVTTDSDPTDGEGGALHIGNTGNTGGGLTVYSNTTIAQQRPLVEFRGLGTGFDQPVLKLQGQTANSSPLYLVPQNSGGSTGQEGEIYMDTDHLLYYHNGTTWIALTCDSSGELPASTESHILRGNAASGWDDTDDITADGAGNVTVKTSLSVSDNNITNVGDIALDSISGESTNAIQIGDGDDTITINDDWTAAAQTCADLGIVTTVDITDGTANFTNLTSASIADTALTATRLVYVGAGKVLADDEDMVFDGDTLTLKQFTTSANGDKNINAIRDQDDMAADSDTALATQKSIKAYVDNQVTGSGFAYGTGDATQVAYWVNETTIDSDAGMTYSAAGDQLTVTNGTFTVLTATTSIADTSLDAGRVVYTGTGGVLSEDDEFLYSATDDKVTLNSGASTGDAMVITTNSLTTGHALEVTSSGVGGNTDALVYIERTGAGQALQIKTNNPTATGVWVEADDIVGGRVMTVKANDADMTGSGYVLYAIQDNTSAHGHALVAQQDGDGNALRAIVSTDATAGANAGFFNQGVNSDSVIAQTTGGALHVDNTENIYGALTVYSNKNADQAAPLATIKTNDAAFDQALFAIDPVVGGNGPHMYLKPINGPTPQALAAGMLYASSTTESLMYYNGTAWISLTGAGGAGLPSGTANYMMRYDDTNGWEETANLTITDGGVLVFNNGAGADNDAQFKSENNANLLYLDSDRDAIGIGTTPGTSYMVTIQQSQAAEGGLLITQNQVGNALNIVHDAAANEEAVYIANADANEALFIAQAGITDSADPSASSGGAIHVYNSNASAGAAITAYADSDTPATPLVWFQVGSSFGDKPVLQLTGRTDHASPLYLEAQNNGGAGNIAGEIFMDTDGYLKYNNGSHWVALTGIDAGGQLPAFGTANNMLRDSGAGWVSSGGITEDGSGNVVVGLSLSVSDGNITNVGDIALYSISGAANAIAIGDGDDTVTINPTAGTSFSDKNITNVGDIALDSISGESTNAIQIGDGDDTITINDDWTAAAQTCADLGIVTTVDITDGTANFTNLTSASIADTALADGRMVFVGTGKVLADDEDMTFDGDTLTIKQFTTSVNGEKTINAIRNQNDMAADSDTALATQQSIKAYVDNQVTGSGFAYGTGDATEVAYWVNETTIDSDAGMTYSAAGDQLTVTNGTFTVLTATTSIADTSLDAGGIVYTGTGGVLSEDDQFLYDATNDKVTLNSGATTTDAMEITADALTSGHALEVTSSSAGATNQSMVYIERSDVGRALEVRSDNPTASGVWIESDTITSGVVMTVKANSGDFTTGQVLAVIQEDTGGSGPALFVQQNGGGKALAATVSSGAAAGGHAGFFTQGANSDSTIEATAGGALHVNNTGNVYGGITLFSGQVALQAAPLMTIKTTQTTFDWPILALDQSELNTNTPHLYLKPINLGTPENLVQGLLYADATTNSLMYYNGTAWISLTGSAGGTGEFATVALDNLDSVAINADLLPDGDNTRNLGSAAANWANFYADTSYLATVDINAGNIDNTKIGVTTPSYGEFTEVNAGFVRLGSSVTAVSPDLSWDGDKNTGLYWIGSDTIGFATGGTLEATLTSGGRWRMRASGTEALPVLTIGGGAHDTGIYRSGDNLNFSNAASRGFTMRSDKVFDLVGDVADPADTEGGIFYNTTTKSLKYNDGSNWITLTGADPANVSGAGDDTYVTYWTGVDTISGEDTFTYDADGHRLTAANATFTGLTAANATFTGLTAALADINGGTIDGTTIGQDSASLGKFTALTATGDVNFDGGTFTFNESLADLDAQFFGDEDPNLLFLSAGPNRVGIGLESTAYKLSVANIDADTNTDGVLSLKQYSANTGAVLFIEHDGVGGDCINIVNNGTSGTGTNHSININHADTATDEAVIITNEEDSEAIYVDQNGATNTILDENDGGAIHVGNTGNTGSAISAYSELGATADAPLVWFALDGNGVDQPVVRIDTENGDAPHLFLNPIVTEPASFTQPGSIYADTDGSLYYRGNAAWLQCNNSGDFAELMESVRYHSEYEPGEVIIQSSIPLAVDSSGKPYESSIAGVVSDRSHSLDYSMPENDYRIVVGFIGLVGCKVTNEGGPIMPGDKLVTSSTPGYAMKADLNKLRGWQIVGTAREPFDGEEGMIEIMVGK